MAVAHTRVFFGHQSVGNNILGAVPGVYADHGVPAPPIEQGDTQPGPDGGFIAHQYIGENGKPLRQTRGLRPTMRGGIGRQVDVALMNIDVEAAWMSMPFSRATATPWARWSGTSPTSPSFT